MPLPEPDPAFPAGRNLTFLFALRPDGSPIGWPMTSVLDGDLLTFSTYAKAAKVRTCLEAGQATALVVRRAGDEIVRAVCASGTVGVVRPGGHDPARYSPADPGGRTVEPGASAGETGAPAAEPGGQAPGGQAPAPAIPVPQHVRDRAQAAMAEGRRVTLTLDVSAGASWSANLGEEAGHAEA